MNYTFYKKEVDTTKRVYFLVKAKTDFSVLENIEFTIQNKHLIKIIINGIKSTLDNVNKYEWANEVIHIAAFKEGVFLFDILARIGGMIGNGPDLQLTHLEFIKFMEDFKKFIEENS